MMNAIVVYESHWGNTESVARAVAAGLGSGAEAMPTSDATPNVVSAADLLVVGAPLLGFALANEKMIDGLKNVQLGQPAPADVPHPSVREWLETIPGGSASMTAFETRVRWSPGSAIRTIVAMLEEKGYSYLSPAKAFLVGGRFGPLRRGELESATAWGRELAAALTAA